MKKEATIVDWLLPGILISRTQMSRRWQFCNESHRHLRASTPIRTNECKRSSVVRTQQRKCQIAGDNGLCRTSTLQSSASLNLTDGNLINRVMLSPIFRTIIVHYHFLRVQGKLHSVCTRSFKLNMATANRKRRRRRGRINDSLNKFYYYYYSWCVRCAANVLEIVLVKHTRCAGQTET